MYRRKIKFLPTLSINVRNNYGLVNMHPRNRMTPFIGKHQRAGFYSKIYSCRSTVPKPLRAIRTEIAKEIYS